MNYKLKSDLPSHCNRVAQYWATLVCFDIHASGKAAGMKYKAARAFHRALRLSGLSDKDIHRAYTDTIEMARLIKSAE